MAESTPNDQKRPGEISLQEASSSPQAANTPTVRDAGTQSGNLAGRTLGGCLLLHKIGEGGMGAVYKATHLGLEKTVAIKILPPELSLERELIERFRYEARALARIDHPNIVGVHHVGEETGIPFLVMPFLEGSTLSERVLKGPLDPREAARVARAIADGLHAAHQAGIVHRDLKPQNVIIAPDGTPKIIDFGLARERTRLDLTQSGEMLGTPMYMAPEQCKGGTVDHRADLYALGGTLYFSLTGKPPYEHRNLYDLLNEHVKSPPPDPRARRPDVPEELARIVTHLMTKDPAARYQDARSVVADLDRFLADRPVERPRSPATLIGIALAAICVLAILLWRLNRQLEPEPAPISPKPVANTKLPVPEPPKPKPQPEPVPPQLTPEPPAPIALHLECRAYGQNVKLTGLTITVDATKVDPTAITLVPDRRNVVRIEHDQLEPSQFTLTPPPRQEQRLSVDLEARRNWRGMIFIPPGEFRSAGSTERKRLSGYYIDPHEVSNADFEKYVSAGGSAPIRNWPANPDLPVRCVTWPLARDYAAWAGKRLPTADEWERAATGTKPRQYPWGDTFDKALANTRESDLGGPVAVGSATDVSEAGCHDMAGNVREWTATPAKEIGRYIIKGGSYDDHHTFGRTWSARELAETDWSAINGFRCAADFLPGLMED